MDTATATAAIKTPDAETETPTRIQPTKSVSLTNGVLKRLQPLHHHHHHSPPVVVVYKECLKNHAASLGGHAVDGCGEFMPSPTFTPADPTSLKCAACGCHRNFHRRDPEDSLHPPANSAPAQNVMEYHSHHRHHPPPPHRGGGGNSSSPNSPSPPPISSSYYPSAPHMLLALSAGLSGPPPPENNNPSIPTTPGTGAGVATGSNPNGRKRFRTKFSQDQKERMHELAERVGWKMQKRDEEMIAGVCNEIAVDKGVFKVWMHNNKSTFQKRDHSTTPATNNTNGSSGGIDFSRNNLDTYNDHHHQNDAGNNHQQEQQHNNSNNNDSVSTGHVVTTNGSSSSS